MAATDTTLDSSATTAGARDAAAGPADAGRSARLYRAAWRWHFYAGIFVIPFFLILAVTGMMMLWIAFLDGRDGELTAVVPQGAPVPVSQQAEAALAAVPGGHLVQYVAPRQADLAAIFRVDDAEGVAEMVVVDPYRATVLDQFPRRSGWYDWADALHGELRLGVMGDRVVEIAASLGIVLLATGLYLWWPRDGGVARALLPGLGLRGRALWKSLHASVGIWISVLLLFFLISGLSWAGIWGGKMVQAWSSFPAEKWDNVPLSDETHAAMNHGPKEVPWALEQTPMPASGSQAGVAGLVPGTPVTLETVAGLARTLGFDGRFQLAAPAGEDGVWTISRDSMSNDSSDPTSDRTVHVDRYTGRILADVGYADYSVYGKAMAVGIALHEGDLGWWNVALNTVYCLGVIFLAASGVVMWWKRRPSRAFRLAAPPPRDVPLWKGAVVIAIVLSVAFPLAGLAILGAVLIDTLVLSRLPAAKRLVS